MSEEGKQKRKNKWKNTEKSIQQCVEEIKKENDELKTVEVDVLTKFIKDEIESSINDVDVDIDIDDNEQERIIGLKIKYMWLAMRYLILGNLVFRHRVSPLLEEVFFLVWIEDGQRFSKIWWC